MLPPSPRSQFATTSTTSIISTTQQPTSPMLNDEIEFIPEQVASILNLADKGDVDHQIRAGLIYRDGIDVKKDDAKSIRYFLLAEAQGSSDATQHINNLFLAGRGLHVSETIRSRALSYLEETAASNAKESAQAKYQLGMIYRESNVTRAILLFREASDADVLDALNQLANLLCQSTNRSKINLTYLKLAADKLGHSQAALEYAESFNKDKDIFTGKHTIDEFKLLHYYQLAANKGNKLAAFRCHEITTNIGVEEDSNFDFGTLSWIKTSNKEEVKRSASIVGVAYLRGDEKLGILPNSKKAERYLHRATEAGDGKSAYLLKDLIKQHLSITGGTSGIRIYDSHVSYKENLIKCEQVAIADNYLPAVLENKAHSHMPSAFKLYQLLRDGETFLDLLPSPEKSEYFFKLALQNEYLPALKQFAKGMTDGAAKEQISKKINVAEEKEADIARQVEQLLKQDTLSMLGMDQNTKYNVSYAKKANNNSAPIKIDEDGL